MSFRNDEFSKLRNAFAYDYVRYNKHFRVQNEGEKERDKKTELMKTCLRIGVHEWYKFNIVIILFRFIFIM